MSKKKFAIVTSIIAVGMALILAFAITVNVLSLTMFDNIFEQALGTTEDSL